MSDKKHRQADACDTGNAEREAPISNAGDEESVNPVSDGKKTDPNGKKAAESTGKELEALKSELKNARDELEKNEKQCADYLERLQRMAAEFDNFKKRSIKEKESLYIDAVSDVAGAFLPVMDNVERALKAINADESSQTLKDGVEMVFKQFGDVLKNLGVEEIMAAGGQFDPMRHNAVMHVEDETLGHNIVIEEFQKGFIYKDKVIRYSMVKVAN